MRDNLPYHFIRETKNVVFVDPKVEIGLFWDESMKQAKKQSHDFQLPNSELVFHWGKTRSHFPIQDETHKLYDLEAEKAPVSSSWGNSRQKEKRKINEIDRRKIS